ncbi:diacylglycerol kinase [Pararhodobacter oceanensis]|uniref:Diacylglycerol kinase n=1 Tax=Pararhodobacter oceanensis TaxID=2172121 RepID=A0A2T8HPI5_9RHOB|nr:diacylglycerol kinase [Pararhodobacter oceanensis]PVH27358.1 diacylglycerol kinase [Pararhodobacter oceanensis]
MSEDRNDKHIGLQRVLMAMGASLKGARYVFIHESAFRQELFLAAIAILCSLFFLNDWFSLIAVMSSWLLVLIVEVLNTAIETIVDRISLERHPLSGAAKDLGSLAVALSLINAFAWSIYAVVL